MFASLNEIIGPLYFWLFALAALGCGSGVVWSRHPLHGAVCLIGAMLALAGIYAIIGAPFLGVLQVLVYAGAIMMLVVFVIMVLNKARDHEVPKGDALSWASAIGSIAITAVVVYKVAQVQPALAARPVGAGEVSSIAPRLFDLTAAGPGWWLLFLLAAVVLLVAIVAAVLLAKRSLDTPEAPVPPKADDHAH